MLDVLDRRRGALQAIHADTSRDRRGIDTAFLFGSKAFKARDVFHNVKSLGLVQYRTQALSL